MLPWQSEVIFYLQRGLGDKSKLYRRCSPECVGRLRPRAFQSRLRNAVDLVEVSNGHEDLEKVARITQTEEHNPQSARHVRTQTAHCVFFCIVLGQKSAA